MIFSRFILWLILHFIFISSFLVVVTSLHTIMVSGKSFHWRKGQQRDFEETYEIGYVIEVVLMQGGICVCCYCKVFHRSILNYPPYDKGLYALVQDMKKWKHCFMGNKAIIHIDHQLLQYLKAHSKLQHTTNYKLMGLLQQFHLAIKYKKGITKKLANTFSRPPTSNITNFGTLMHMDLFNHDACKRIILRR